MFCPKCKAEYRQGFTYCSDCGVTLVERLEDALVFKEPVAEKRDSPDYVGVRTVQTRYEEAQILSFLEANNIPAIASGEAVGKVYGLTVDGLGGTRILVPRNLADAARSLLDKADAGELEIAESPE